MKSNNVQVLFPTIASYKKLFKTYLDRRPSGTRQKLASALGTHKSFISQITNPNYRIPIPSQHVTTMMSICHFSVDERKSFMKAYLLAHPGVHFPLEVWLDEGRHVVHIVIPDLGDAEQEHELAVAIRETAARMIALVHKPKK